MIKVRDVLGCSVTKGQEVRIHRFLKHNAEQYEIHTSCFVYNGNCESNMATIGAMEGITLALL